MTLQYHAHYLTGWGGFLLSALIAWGASYLFYRRSSADFPAAVRHFKRLLRAVSVLVVVMASAGGIWQFDRQVTVRARLALMIDASPSMAVPRQGDIPEDVIRQWLESDTFRRLSRRYDIDFMVFSDSVQSASPERYDIVPGSGTDLNAMLTSLMLKHAVQPYQGALLISDGRDTRQGKEASLPAGVDLPFWCVAMGDSSEYGDAAIAAVEAPRTLIAGQPSEMKVRIASSGAVSPQGRLSVTHSGNTVLDTIVALPSDGFQREVSLRLPGCAAGQATWRISLRTDGNESTLANNVFDHWAQVRHARRRIAVLSSRAQPDLAAFLRALKHQSFDIDLWVEGSGGTRQPALSDTLDALVLWDYPAGNSADWPRMLSDLGNRQPPLFLVAGKTLDPSRLAALPDMEWTSGLVRTAEHPVMVMPARQTWESMTWAPDWPERNLAPLVTQWRGDWGDALLVDEEGRDAVLMTDEQDGRRMLLLLGQGFYRWPLAQQGRSPIDWAVLMSWLTDKVREHNRLYINRSVFETGEQVLFSALLADEAGSPLAGLAPVVSIARQGHTVWRSLTETSPGAYEARIPQGRSGRFTAVLKMADGEPVDSVDFRVMPYETEVRDISVHRSALARIAAHGGSVIEAAQIDSLGHWMALSPSTGSRIYQWRVYSSWETLILLLLCLGTEWWLRRRHGQL